MTSLQTDSTSFTGQLLAAMPNMPDPRFERGVVYVCAHSPEGAMGIIINKLFGALTFGDLLKQLGIETHGSTTDRHVHFGGPVEPGRGFVLHTTDHVEEGSVLVNPDIALTGTLDMLHAIAEGRGPKKCLFALGYAGWGPGQLDEEIQTNGWIQIQAVSDLVFDPDTDNKWERTLTTIGIDPSMLSFDAGHA